MPVVRFFNNPNVDLGGLVTQAEIHFVDEPVLAGMKMVGFAIWKSSAGELWVQLPSARGLTKNYDFLRGQDPKFDQQRKDELRAFILEAWLNARKEDTGTT